MKDFLQAMLFIFSGVLFVIGIVFLLSYLPSNEITYHKENNIVCVENNPAGLNNRTETCYKIVPIK